MSNAVLIAGLSLVASLLLVVGVVELLTERRARLLKQLWRHVSMSVIEARPASPQGPRRVERSGTSFPWLEAVLSASARGERMRLDLLRADVKLRVGEYQAIRVTMAGAGFAIATMLGHSLIIAGVGAIGGYLLPGILVGMKRKKRLGLLNTQVVDALDLIATSLRSGFSFLQGLEAVRHEMPAPLSEEIGRTLREISLGASTEDALLDLVYRTGDADLRLAVTAVLVQRRVGGNLAEVLTNIGQTLRERIRIRGEINTLTAQARGSGMIVGCLPIGLGVLLYIMNPDYMSVLLNHPTGRLMLGVAIVSQVTGFVLIRKLIEVDF